jgi:hypothetical protein
MSSSGDIWVKWILLTTEEGERSNAQQILQKTAL